MIKEKQCHLCEQTFFCKIYWIQKQRNQENFFCSRECLYLHQNKTEVHPCKWCLVPVTRKQNQLRKINNVFCTKSCAASYNNTQRRKSRRSKCEQLLCSLIQNHYPDLVIEPNNKTMLDGFEIDIAIPSLNFGIEWNGIVHFKPIYGEAKLKSISDRDRQKEEIAKKKGVHLVVIPDLVSTDAYVRESFMKIKPFIEDLKSAGGVEPLGDSFAGN